MEGVARLIHLDAPIWLVLLSWLFVLLCCLYAWWRERHGVLLIALALLQSAPPDPGLVARLDAPGQSTVTWQADRALCLYYQGTLDSCYPSGRVVVTFGHSGPLDAVYRPAVGGEYQLYDPSTGATWRATLRRPVLLPVVRR